MSAQSPTITPKSPVSDARFWYCVIESTNANGKLDYDKLAEMTGYKNWNSAKVAFFTKRKQWRINEVKGEDGVKKEVDTGVKKRGRKKKETIKGKQTIKGKEETKQEVKQEVKEEEEEEEGYTWRCDSV